MFVALEGCDGTGKSSLAKAIADQIRAQFPEDAVREIHSGPLAEPPLDAYIHSVSDYMPTGHGHVVVDRWHWGELIYGPIYRGESALTLAQFRWAELWLASRGAAFWHVTQPLDRLQERLEQRGEDFLQSHHVDLVRREFEEVAGSSLTCAGTVSPEGPTDTMVEQIVTHAEFAEHEAGTLTQRHPTYVGRSVPHTLLVGQKRGGKPPYVTESAFMPVNGNSAEFLLSSLDSTWWKGVGMINAEEENDIPGLVDELAGPQVLALGRAASDVLLDNDIDHGGVPHPQYVRRFHSKKADEYGRLIRENARTGEMKFSWPN